MALLDNKGHLPKMSRLCRPGRFPVASVALKVEPVYDAISLKPISYWQQLKVTPEVQV